MIESTPTPAMTDAELETWFSEAGIVGTVVERCPTPTCAWCSRPLDNTLADAA